MRRILAIDIGTGTKDILLFDPERRLSNCAKLVLPSNSKVQARRVEEASTDLHFTGRVVGGGPMVKALKKHTAQGYQVSFSPEAAFTVKNDTRKVLGRGFAIQSHPEPGARVVTLDELDLPALLQYLGRFDLSLREGDGIAVAVQDHGNAPEGISDRKFRWDLFLEHLERSPRLDSFIYGPGSLPGRFFRLNSVAEYLEKGYPGHPWVVADTCVAAIMGCVSSRSYGLPPSEPPGAWLILNMGNSHTMAAVMRGDVILALFEHHTYQIARRPKVLARFLEGLLEGTIQSEDVFDDGGEGAVVRQVVGAANITRFLATGPRREHVLDLELPLPVSVEFAAPGGDVMMTGPVGLIEAFEHLHGRGNK